ncbi:MULTISPECIES: hypothetical protein [unclassified Francisella]|uniref:hypothetical protein n=1 Tax=unclassified Francisella TaxID=2610885 RepID=UPI002E38210F|nr:MULTISPECIES: hypothetical protein [unclassified Francisella]MED7818341.1 hypothetical protein [Francisella sp. 19S2-4]MED7829177.1 hypothetical protein [Francisella sp. 19S2-10]
MIRKILNKSMVLLLVLLLSSCATTQNQWPYKKDGIVLNISSGKTLNVYNGYNHSLTLGVLQTSTRNKYTELMKSEKGLSYLLSNEMKDKTETGFDRIFIEPNTSNKEITLDRHENTQYIYLIFGYADSNQKANTQVITIPADKISDDLVINMKLGADAPETVEYSQDGIFVRWIKKTF